MVFYIILLVFFLSCSAFFSGSETTIFSLSPLALQKISSEHKRRGRIINYLVKNSQKLLVTILICNLFVNMSAALVMDKLIHNRLLAIFISTVLILIIGELTPKTIAMRLSTKLVLYISPIMYLLTWLLTPFSFIFRTFSDFLIDMYSFFFYRNAKEPVKFYSEEMLHVIDDSLKKGIISREEGNILENIIAFSKTELYHILRPRDEMFSLPLSMNIKAAFEKIKEKKFTRIPIWDKKEDNIVGILNIKDLLKVTVRDCPISHYREILRKPMFVPDSIEPQKLLHDFQITHNHLAVVIDEYGDIAGLVTVEDVIEKIIGEVIDKDDIRPMFYKYDSSMIDADGRIEIKEFNKVFKTNLKTDGAATLAGYILNKLRKIPKSGEIFVINNLQFKITSALPNKIDRMMITKIKRSSDYAGNPEIKE